MTIWNEMNLFERFVERRQADMERDKDLYLPVLNEIVSYVRPDLTGDTDRDIGKQMGQTLVEGTAHFDAAIMAKWFMGNLVGPALTWLRYRMSQLQFRGDDEINGFLQRVADFMLEEVYAYPHSNFYETNGEFVLDGLTMGSPVMLTEFDAENDRTVCILPHFTENYLMRDWFGSDVAYHRKMEITNFAAEQAFGKDNLPFAVQNELKQGIYHTKHPYLLCIARAGDPIFQDLKPDDRIPLSHPWMMLWFCLYGATTRNEKKPLNYRTLTKGDGETYLRPDGSKVQMPTSASGFFHKPFNSWHYHRLPHETYSRTPAWTALPDIKGLNSAWRSIHEAAHQAALPATLAVQSLKPYLNLGAEQVTWVPDEAWEKRPQPYESKSQYNWAMDFIDRRTKTVGRHFFADMARMIENYSRDHKQPPTAYQLSQMISETIVLIGPAITSYAGPALQNVDDQMMEIQMRTGKLWRETDPPDRIWQTNGKVLPVFTGPLMQGLRYAMLSKRIQQPLMMAAPVFELVPESKIALRWDDLVETILEGGDFPQGIIVPKEERQAMMEAMQAERRQQQMLDRMSQGAEMVPNLQGETPDDSPLRKLAEVA